MDSAVADLRPVEPDEVQILASRPSGFWTDARIDLLKKLHAEGVPYTRIASEIGNCSLSMVAGKINRLGLASARPVTMKKSGPKPRANFAFPAPLTPAASIVKPKPKPDHNDDSIAAIGIELDLLNTVCEIFALDEGRCHWPLWGEGDDHRFYCGGKSAHRYCGHHNRIAYQPVRAR
jgi:GcrA cell cycle regulator